MESVKDSRPCLTLTPGLKELQKCAHTLLWNTYAVSSFTALCWALRVNISVKDKWPLMNCL